MNTVVCIVDIIGRVAAEQTQRVTTTSSKGAR